MSALNDLSTKGLNTVHQQLADALSDPFSPFSPLDTQPAIPLGSVLEVDGAHALCVLQCDRINVATENGDMAGQVGGHVKCWSGQRWVIGALRSLKLDPQNSQQMLGRLDFVGEATSDTKGNIDEFRRGVTSPPNPGVAVHAISDTDLSRIFTADGKPHITIGAVHPSAGARAALLIDPFLSKHFAVLGSTGTGKSTTTALILRRIVASAPQSHILMLDPHGEYGAAFGDIGVIYDVKNLELPYWLMNFDEHVQLFIGERSPAHEVEVEILAKCLLTARSKSRMATELGKITVDSPVPYLLSDLLAALQTSMGKLDKPEKIAPFLRLRANIEEMRSDPRYGFLLSGLLVADTLSDFLTRLFRMPGNGKSISIIDLSGVPSEIVATIVAVIARLTFDFAIWSKRDQQRPMLIVCEEAHRYVPCDTQDMAHTSPSRRILERIAKEGRKYGVALGLISQRPSDLSESVISQCGTIIAMRMNNDRDQAYVKNALPEAARGYLEAIPSLRNREAVICGEGVLAPMRVRLDELPPEERPASDDPVFSKLWTSLGGEHDLIDRTIRRWRTQGR